MVKYYYARGTRVAMRAGLNAPLLLLGDHLGSTSQVANYDGSAYTNGNQLYKPWGEKRYPSGASGLPTTYRYTGQRQESGLGGSDGLYYYGARWYDSQLGRWNQPDTILPQSQGTQAWDRLAYVNNNPVAHNDPSGHGECDGIQDPQARKSCQDANAATPTTPPIVPCPPSDPSFTTSGGYFTGPASSSYANKAEDSYTDIEFYGNSSNYLAAIGDFIGFINDTLSSNQAAIMSLSGAPDVSGQIYYEEYGNNGMFLTGVSLQNETASTVYMSTINIQTQNSVLQLYPNPNSQYQTMSYGTASPYRASGIVNIPPTYVQYGYNASILISVVNTYGQYASVIGNTEP